MQEVQELRSRKPLPEEAAIRLYERQRNQTEKRKTHLYATNLKRWRRENPHKLAGRIARRRAQKLNAEGDFTVEEFEALCEGLRGGVPPLR